MTATVNLKSLSSCSGGKHRHIRITIGAQNREFDIHGTDFADSITEEDWRNLTVLLLRLHQLGRTFAQLDTLISGALGVDTVVS